MAEEIGKSAKEIEESRLPLEDHKSFDRPPATTRLWRYTDIPKFLDLITSGMLWLTNIEMLATDDPYEGRPSALQFPHRKWRSLDEVPEKLRSQIILMSAYEPDSSPAAAFRSWFMRQEQSCIMTRSGRRNFYVNCWHAAAHESVAMWKIYGSPGAGIAVVTNGARLEAALTANDEKLYLGAVKYRDPTIVDIGTSNVFDTILVKRIHYNYEAEVRLVHWHTGELHNALEKFAWNDETMRFDDIIEDTRPIRPGRAFACDINAMIEMVIISPFAPPWYVPMIARLRERLGFRFPIHQSRLLDTPPVIP